MRPALEPVHKLMRGSPPTMVAVAPSQEPRRWAWAKCWASGTSDRRDLFRPRRSSSTGRNLRGDITAAEPPDRGATMSHPLDSGLGRFRALIQKTSPAGPRLPLIHSTDAYAVGTMLEDGGKIEPQPCSIFKPERLTYLFYGRPAYRPNQNELPTDLQHYLPVCLIFRPSATIAIKRMFPFDSGAFDGDFYRSYLHKRMQLGDFRIEADADTPGRVVRRFFSDNTNYVMGRAATSEAHDPSEFEADSYACIIGPSGANALDSRGAAIEVQTDRTIELSGNVEAAILPSSQSRAEIGRHLRDAGIRVIPYRVGVRPRPGDFPGKIEDKVIDYLCRAKLIDKNRI
jgi:hypothetical protein